MEKLPDLAALTHEEKDKLIIDLYQLVAGLRLQIRQQSEELEKLKGQLSKTSQNSSKPPSSDGLNKPAPKSLRQKSDKKSGGQKGHQGHHLQAVSVPDHIEYHSVRECEHCHCNLDSVNVEGYEERQVFDIPVPGIEVTAHRAQRKRCSCGHLNVAHFPSEVNASVQYGSRIKALGVYFNQYQLIPYERVEEMLEELYGVSLSEGSLYTYNLLTYQALENTEIEIKSALKVQPLLCADESGVRIEGQLHWVHVASTDKFTHYQHHEKRGQCAMNEIGILPAFTGIVVHDHLKSYLRYTSCAHSLCNAHHLRELVFLLEQHKLQWAAEMIRLLVIMKKCVDRAKNRHQEQLYPKLKELLLLRYTTILQEGLAHELLLNTDDCQLHLASKRGRKKQSKAKNLLDRLSNYQDQVLRFITDFQVPFDNNQAERDIRMVKLKQKISGTFRSQTGAKVFFRIRSYLSCAKKQGHNILKSLTMAICGSPLALVA